MMRPVSSKMNIMKRLFFILSIVLMVSSCFGDGPMTTKSYTLVASFEYSEQTYTDEEFFGADSLYFDAVNGMGFGYGDMNFFHKADTVAGEFKGGFLLSYLDIPTSEVTEGLDNRYRVNSTQGLGRNTFAVFHQNEDESMMPEHDSRFLWTQYGTCVMVGCHVNNTVMVADSIKANFQIGDRLVVKATGWLNSQKTGEAEVILADFSAQKDSIVTAWTEFDLSELGSVEYVDFEIESSNQSVPLYFCIDNITASVDLAY